MAKVWEALDTATLLGCPQSVVQVRGLVHGHIGVVGGVLGSTGDWKELRVRQILTAVLVEVGPVHGGPRQVGGVNGRPPDFLLKMKLIHGDLLLGEVSVTGKEPDAHQFPRDNVGQPISMTPGIQNFSFCDGPCSAVEVQSAVSQ